MNDEKKTKSFPFATEDWATLRWLAERFRPTTGLIVAAICGETISSANGVLFAFCVRDVVDAATAGNRSRLVATSATSAALLVWSLLVSLFVSAVVERIRARSEIELQSRTFRGLLRKDYSATSCRHSGDVLNRLTSDVKVVCDGASTILPKLAALSTQLIFAFAALCYFTGLFALIFLAAGSVVFLSARLFRRLLKKLHKEMQEAEGSKRAFWQEALENLFVVKSFSRENLVERYSQTLQRNHFNATLRRRNFGLFASGAISFVFSFGYLFALVWQAFRLLAGTTTFGTLTATLQLIWRVQTPFSGLSGLLPRYFSALASAERLRELEEIPDEIAADSPDYSDVELARLASDWEALVFESISFRYRRDEKEVAVLENASFEIPRGANVVFRGRSGIGKSSLFKLTTGVCAPTSGRIFWRTRDSDGTIREVPLDRRTRRMFACVPQGNLLFSGTIRENLAFFEPDVSETALAEALRLAGAEFVADVPGGLDARLGENGLGLSEGQIQRLAIARALLSDAPILLLDEATSALDSVSERGVLERLKNESKKTFFAVSHRPAAFEFANLVATFDDERDVEISKVSR